MCKLIVFPLYSKNHDFFMTQARPIACPCTGTHLLTPIQEHLCSRHPLFLLKHHLSPLFWIILGSMKMSFYLPCLRQKHQQTPSLESSNPHLALHFITRFFSSLSTPMLSWTNPLYAFSPYHSRGQVFTTVINEITLLNLQPM